MDYPDLGLIWSPHSLSADRGEYTCAFSLFNPTDLNSKTISELLRDDEDPSIQGNWHMLAQFCDSDQADLLATLAWGFQGGLAKLPR